MNTRKMRMAALVLAAGLSSIAQAALHDRGGGLVYDDVLNVTWLQDANYAKTSGYDNDGKMDWTASAAWAANLVYHDSVRNVDYSDWRLPTMVDTGSVGCNHGYSGTDCGWNVQTVSGSTVYSEMAYMYHINLGLKSEYSPTGEYQSDFGVFGNGTLNGTDGNMPYGQKDIGLIHNLQAYFYWSSLEYASLEYPDSAWYFITVSGYQAGGTRKYNELYAWAVRPGDVAAVPEADTWAMLLAGLGLVGVVVRRRK